MTQFKILTARYVYIFIDVAQGSLNTENFENITKDRLRNPELP